MHQRFDEHARIWRGQKVFVWFVLTDVALVLFWSAAILFVILGALPESAISTSYRFRRALVVAMPEGYGFFTRDPQETRVLIYAVDGNGNASPANESDYRGLGWSGVSRKSSVRAMEVKTALALIKPDAWVSCDKELGRCLQDRSLSSIPVKPEMTARTLCGRIVLRRQKPVPWAWSKSNSRIHMPSSIALVDFQCGEAS